MVYVLGQLEYGGALPYFLAGCQTLLAPHQLIIPQTERGYFLALFDESFPAETFSEALSATPRIRCMSSNSLLKFLFRSYSTP